MITQTDNHPTSERNLAQQNWLSPVVNITEDKEGYLLEAEMPGVNKEGLELLLEGNELTIIGHKQTDGANAQPLYRESTSRDYRRVFMLDPTIDTDRISAQIEHGLLHLHLPKAERVKPRKIKVAD